MWRRIGNCMVISVLIAGALAYSQSMASGDIRGTVFDSTGAVIPGVTVSVLNVETSVSKDFVTNQDGLYDTSSIVAGRYKLSFTKSGFETLVRGPITIDVGVTAVNTQLKIGQVSQQITVTTDVPLLNIESGDQTATLEASSMAELPQVGKSMNSGNDFENFMILLPGVNGTTGGAMGAADPGQSASANGNMPFTNMLQDGASVTLPASQNANPTAFDDVQEVQISLSSFSAQYGVGGMIMNQITKGGTAKFHGTAYEYFMNNDLNAANFGFGSPVKVPFLRYNNYGGTLGGPIPVRTFKHKAFFFFGYDRIDDNGNSTGYTTLPTTNAMAGNFTGFYTLYDPFTQTIGTDSAGNPYPIRKTFASECASGYYSGCTGNQIPASLIDSVSAAVQALYPTASNSVGSYVPGTLQPNGVLQNNWYENFPSPQPWRRYFGRMDYDITPNNRLTVVDNQGDEIEDSANAVFACPIACQLGDVDNNNASISDVWNISPTTINEARMGYTDQLNFFSDSTTGLGYPAKLGWKFAEADVVPGLTISGYGALGAATNAKFAEFTFDPSDVVTMIRGKHILHFGGEMAFYRDDATPWGNINAGSMSFSGQYTEDWTLNSAGVASPNSGTGASYADFLLGVSKSWNANYVPEFGARLKKPQMFVQDDWKMKRNLTVNLGLRYEISHGFNEVTGNEASFDPTVINPATSTLGAEWYGSTAANGRKSLQANVFSTIMPRLGFSWEPLRNTTVNGGFGIYSYNFSLDNYGGGMGGAIQHSGSFTDQSNGIYPAIQFDGSGALFPLGGGTGSVSTLYTAGGTSPARFNGQGVNYDDFHTPIPKIYEWNFTVQRQLSADYVVSLAYIGSHGFNLTMPTDLNAVPQNDWSSSDSADRPYPNFQGISGNLYGALSNYNSLQAQVTKRFSHGLSMNVNYVWSHMLSDMDSSGWGSHAGAQIWQYACTLTMNAARLNYGNSNFDLPQALKGYAVYQLPFGKGKQFFNNNVFADEVFGGWQISGTMLELAGNPFQVTSPGSLYSLAGNGATQYPNVASGVGTTPPGGKSWHNWFNEAAFGQPAAGQPGNAIRNPLRGPGINEFTLSGGKDFSIWEGVKFSLRCDATNAFNHPSFGAIGVGSNSGYGLTGGSPGSPFSGTAVLSGLPVGGREVELSGRISF